MDHLVSARGETTTAVTTRRPAIRAVDIHKRFGHVVALRGASLEAYPGEILALIGDNGAGKSTLTKIICGALRPDRGELWYLGKQLAIQSVSEACELGVQTVYQDLAQAPDLTVVQNMFLGRELLRSRWNGALGVLDTGRMAGEARQALLELGISLESVDKPMRLLSGGQRQAVAVARAVRWARTAILMDEPTAALGAKQTAIVYRTIREAANHGLAVVVVSHDIPRMLETADRIAVMRHGHVSMTIPASQTDLRTVIDLMLGAEVAA